MKTLNALQSKIEHLNPQDALQLVACEFPGEVVFSTAFGLEGQILTDMIFRQNLPIEVFTIDTGRLFEESRQMCDTMRKRYGKEIKVYFPDKEKVEQLTTQKELFSFYDSVENRLECCHIRKVEPLQRALKGKKLWITGLRAGQSRARSKRKLLEWDPKNQIIKFYPLLQWSEEAVHAYIKENEVPYNPLQDQGYPSIGCAPCTRAVKAGEDIRAGRWWWEQSAKECGLHI